jgi:hypothetical protein
VYVQLLGHSTDLNTIGSKVTVVVNVKYLGVEVTFAEEQTAVSHMTWMLPIVYPATVFCSPDDQLPGFAGSGGLLYWIYCPNERNAPHAEINRNPAAAASASGINRLDTKKT